MAPRLVSASRRFMALRPKAPLNDYFYGGYILNQDSNLPTNMTDEEFCALFGKSYFDYIEGLRDDDFEINQPQWLKMLRVLNYFYHLAKASNGTIEPCEVMPRGKHGGVTAYFTVVDIKSNDIPKFCEALMNTSAITIDATLDGQVCISVSVPNVFIPKS